MELEEFHRNPAAEGRVGSSADTAAPSGFMLDRDSYDNDASRSLALLAELGMKPTEESLGLMPKFLSFLKHDDPVVVRHSVATGTRLFFALLDETTHQLQTSGKIEEWLGQMWAWMIQFKDVISGIVWESVSVGTKALAVKFLETCVIFFTSDANQNEAPVTEGRGRNFNMSWLAQGHPILNRALLEVEANKTLSLLVDVLQLATTFSGSFIVVVINCLAAIAKSRPIHYSCILSALLGLNHKFETLNAYHAGSIRHSLRTAFLGFLRCSHPLMTESKDKLLRILRAMNSGEATDQIIRQLEKMSRSMERTSHDIRLGKDEVSSDSVSASGDLIRKRPPTEPNDILNSDDMPAKRTRFNTSITLTPPIQVDCDLEDDDASNGISYKASQIDSNPSPAKKMIEMIGALLAEGERGTESLELLMSNIHPDLFADMVIETIKHRPVSPLGLSGRKGNITLDAQASSLTVPSQVESATSAIVSAQSSAVTVQLTSVAASANDIGTSTCDIPAFYNHHSDVKRDPRRDIRRLDPRRTAEAIGQLSVPSNLEGSTEICSGLSHSPNKISPVSESIIKADYSPASSIAEKEVDLSESSAPASEQLSSNESLGIVDNVMKIEPSLEIPKPLNILLPPVNSADEQLAAMNQFDLSGDECIDDDVLESDQYSSSVSATLVSEDICQDLPILPLYVDLADEQKQALCKLAIIRIIEGHKQIRATGCSHARLSLLARLVAQIDADDEIILLLQKHIVLDYHHRKGHDLAMHILYYLRAVMISGSDGSSSFAANNYEKFLLAVAKALLDALPASDKSFSKLLCEAPFLPDSSMRLLEELCQSCFSSCHEKDICDGDRITQGLGVIWSLILGRPSSRKACLDIALKSAVHSTDEVRAKAIRLVANKLYPLNYASESIENFATSTLLSVVDRQEPELSLSGSHEQRTEEIGSQETSVSGSQNSEPDASESESKIGTQASLETVHTTSLSHAQQQTSLFFALCSKKPSLLQTVFNIYGRAPEHVIKSVHRHVPNLLRTIGSSDAEILNLISNPPEGCESLIMLVLQILTEDATPSGELVTAVKRLYETKLKDAAILIPMLSSFSKDEVLPIFPRLVDLPLEKFQAALARILQGSAHTGPALTPVEVLVAIHDIDPEKHCVALKKITDACTACFEQRTVFTQHVLAKSLSHLVEEVPIPLLFMRTVIQAIDAFPTLVDFVMGILSKLVSKQIWKMKKLWAGFLKCASQTQPHSFNALLLLPPPQLEYALSRYANLKGPLSSFASQPTVRSSLSRQTLRTLGLMNEPQQEASRSYLPAPLHTSDESSPVHAQILHNLPAALHTSDSSSPVHGDS